MKFMMQPTSDTCMPHKNANGEEYTIKKPTHFLYVKSYDVLGKENLPKESVQNMSDCILPKLERHGEDNEDGRSGNCSHYFYLASSLEDYILYDRMH